MHAVSKQSIQLWERQIMQLQLCVLPIYIISDVKVSLIDCGATEVELAFVHSKDSKKGKTYKINSNFILTIIYHSFIGTSIVR